MKRPNAVSPRLVGTWTRTITNADLKRTGATGFPSGKTLCTLTIAKSGASHISCPNAQAYLSGNVVSAGANRVRINLGVPPSDVYKWHVSGRLLTFTKVNDTVPDRVAAMEGVWKRK